MAARRVTATVDAEFGTGQLTVTGHAARITAAHERVDTIARALRRCGDQRTLDQLRSDALLELLMHGQIPASAAPALVDSASGAAPATGASGVAAGLFAATFDPALFGGMLPPARVDVVVPLSVLLGASDEPGMLACGDGQEWLAAAFIRDVAFSAGSTWRRLVTDPVTGHLRDLQVKGYAVTGELRERIQARDRISRAPGRTRPAVLCDTDHDLDYALGGRSSESNLSAKDRRGHNHKTRRTWTSQRAPGSNGIDGEIVWTTPTGRRYATTPWDYRDPEPPPSTTSTPPSSATTLTRCVNAFAATRRHQMSVRCAQSGPGVRGPMACTATITVATSTPWRCSSTTTTHPASTAPRDVGRSVHRPHRLPVE